MARDSAADLAAILSAAGIGLSSGTNLFLGPVLEDDDATVPDTAAFILQTGGDAPQSYIGGGRRTYRSATCQVRIRSGRENYQAGHLLALAAFDALHLANAEPYVRIAIEDGCPNYFGADGSDRHWWSFTVDCEYLDAGTPAAGVVLSAEPVDVAGELAELRAKVAALEARLAAAGL